MKNWGPLKGQAAADTASEIKRLQDEAEAAEQAGDQDTADKLRKQADELQKKLGDVLA